MFHKHNWEILHTEFVPGVMNRSDLTSFEVSGFIDDKIIHGYTEVSMICRDCGEPHVNMIVGHFQDRA